MKKITQATLDWLDDPEVFRVNQLQARSDHKWYQNTDEIQARNSSFAQSLNGEWLFHCAKNPKERPEDFYKPDFPETNFTKIPVPCHIQMAGFDKIHYINASYAWEGHTYRRPQKTIHTDIDENSSFVHTDYNPVGCYRLHFDVKESMRHLPIRICFEGVEQAMYVYLNGHFVGYAEDSFTPSEFDLSPFILPTGNVLAVEVYKWSAAAFIEDQDFFRFSGIFRNVTLLAQPEVHVEDFWAKTSVREPENTGCLAFQANISGATQEKTLLVTLKDTCGKTLLTKKVPTKDHVTFSETIENVHLWENQNPYLYQLTLELLDENQQLIEIVPYQIGFRRLSMEGKNITLNDKRLIFNGTNRHEWSAENGRVLTVDEMLQDIHIFQKNNINAVRTSHYPNQLVWYDLCDAAGIYVMSETNLESHGSWMSQYNPPWNVPGNFPAWREVVVDRARTHFEWLKNHPSILFWSLGNEAYADENILAMHDFFKEADDTRLVHYEGGWHNPAYKEPISDVDSCMYAPPAYLDEYLASKESKRPLMIAEYMHSMGNSVGNMGDYIALLAKHPAYCGGFIWDFIDQALYVQDEVTGEKVLRFGGDFDDRPSDREFCGNGLVFADRTEKPALQEVRYYYGK